MSTQRNLIVGLIIGLAIGLAVGYVVAGIFAPRPDAPARILILNYPEQRLLPYPTTMEQARAEGYIPLDECVPFMGYHYGRIVDGKPVYPLLMFNGKGELIGIEFETLTPPSPLPPWDHLPQGHPGMEFEHWTLHVYWTPPPETCP